MRLMSLRPKWLSVAKHRTARPRGICLALFFIFSSCRQSFAQANDTYREGEEWFDRYQAVVSERVQTASLRLDEWLSGDARDTEAQSDTLLRARLTLQIDESQWVRIRPAISGHLALPAFQKRA